ncbi:MAG TPA: DedA family protein [Symbiobacteriaceae bacterium]|nr:DedA family protein [Symbiobacteriaceae bacterium]
MDIVQSLLETYGDIALVVILFLDSSGVPWPTEATLVVAGIAARNGSLNIFAAFASVLGGAALGSTLSYYLGRRMGPALMRKIAAFFRLSDDTMAKVDDWFEKHGHRAVFFGRLVPFVRNFTGYPAGVMEVPFGKYLLFSLAGYGLYAAFALSLGYFGTAFAQWVGDFEIALWILLPIALLVGWFKWGRKWVQHYRHKEGRKG